MNKFLILILFFSNSIYSQYIDKIIEKHIETFDQTIATNQNLAYNSIVKAKDLCNKTNNQFLLAKCFNKMGYYHYIKNDIQKSKDYLNKSIPIATQYKNYKTLASSYNQLGIIDMDKSDYSASLKKLLFSIKIAEKNHLYLNQCSALTNLGNLFELQKDTIKAMDYYLEGNQIAEKNDLKDYRMYILNNIAILLRKSEKEKSIQYYKKAYKVAEELQDDYQQFSTLINLSDVYLSIDSKSSYSKGLECLQLAEQKAKNLENNQNLFYIYFNYGGYYNKIKDYEQAEKYYLKAKELSRSGIDSEQLLNLDKAFEKNYKANGDFKNAYLYQAKYQLKKDSIFTIDKNKAFNDIQTKYEVEKKNLKIDLLSKEKQIEKTKKRIILYISVAILLPLILLLLFYKKRIKLQKMINEKEQEIKRVLGMVEGQDQERNRIAKEIHDGISGDLAGIKLNLAQINTLIKNKKIDIIVLQLASVFQELRNISHNLSSNFIKNKDFSTILFNFKKEYEERKEFDLNITIFPENTFQYCSENIKHQLHRILQELLANISKHAKAKNVSINITNHNDYLNIMIEDDGMGFEKKEANGIGLKNIKERIDTINGIITIETTIGKGSSFIIDIPNK